MRSTWVVAGQLILALAGPGHAEQLCQADGHSVHREVIYLDRASFTEAGLRAALAQYDRGGDAGETYVLALMETGDPYRYGPPRGDGVHPVVRDGPTALLFQFEGNVFFQFRNEAGEVRWVQVRGENPFLEIRNLYGLELVGLRFLVRSIDPDCRRLHRWLAFGATDPTWRTQPAGKVQALLDLAGRLKGFGEFGENFSVDVYPEVNAATAGFGANFPSPMAMPLYLAERDREALKRTDGQLFCILRWETAQIQGRWTCRERARLAFELFFNLREDPWEEQRLRLLQDLPQQ